MRSTKQPIRFTATALFAIAWAVFADEPDAFASALELALRDAGTPVAMTVNCTDDKGVRSMELYPGGAVVWGRAWQAEIDSKTREALLQELLHANFAHFEDHYGGKAKGAKQEAALRVICRVVVELAGQRKSSVQEVDGERFEGLLALAGALLDRVEALEGERVSAQSLEDGLAKLHSGALAPEALELNYLYLPAGDTPQEGLIVMVESGQLTRRTYKPGSGASDPCVTELTHDTLQGLVEALTVARIEDLPVNLFAEQMHQLEVRVLAHRHAILARPFTGAGSHEPPGANQRFLRLAEFLQELHSDTVH